jgi:hypothetical protein
MFDHIVCRYKLQKEALDYTTVSFRSLSLAKCTGMQLLPIQRGYCAITSTSLTAVSDWVIYSANSTMEKLRTYGSSETAKLKLVTPAWSSVLLNTPFASTP